MVVIYWLVKYIKIVVFNYWFFYFRLVKNVVLKIKVKYIYVVIDKNLMKEDLENYLKFLKVRIYWYLIFYFENGYR